MNTFVLIFTLITSTGNAGGTIENLTEAKCNEIGQKYVQVHKATFREVYYMCENTQ